MKHLRYLLMAALVAMPLTACDDDDDGDGVAPPAVGTVSGTVSAEGDGLAGVSVTLVGATSQSATTGSGGSFSFTNVEAGSYGVTISDIPSGVSFSTTAKTTSITTDGQTVTVDFSGSYIRTSTIAGQVVVDGDGIAGIAVTATGPEGTDDAVTDNGGNYSFSGLRAGDYTVAIDAPADYTFAATSYDITLGTGEAKTASFFGEMVVTEDPVTAEVIIESVKDDDGDFVDPSDVYRDIYVTLGIDPGENSLSRVCVLLDGVELPNGCQTFSSAATDQELQAALS
ncbi:MAG: MSCRAMM family protein, partial [Gemmatimonadota bacterium]